MDNINVEQNYNIVPSEVVAVDSDNNIVERKPPKVVTPFDVIKATAEKLGQVVNDPDKNCKHCLGRGYIARVSETKAPIPCGCISPKNSMDDYISNKMRKVSRKERRAQERKQVKSLKKLKRGNIDRI